MSSIRISDDWPEVVDVLKLASICFRCSCYPLFSLLSVVEQLCHEEMGNLIGNGGLVSCQQVTLRFWMLSDSRMGNLPNPDQAHLMQKPLMTIASQIHKLYLGIWPSESTWLVLNIRRCN